MKISLIEEGGWPAGASPATRAVDLDALERDSAREGQALADRLLASPAAPEGEGRAYDAIDFTIVIDDGSRSVARTAKSTAMGREFAELLTWLKRELESQGPKGEARP